MELYSQNLEIRAIKTICDPRISRIEREILLGKLDKSYFWFPPSKSAFIRVSSIAQKRTTLIDFDDLIEDPTLEEDYRDILKDSEVKACRSKKSLATMVTSLSEYRKARYVYKMCKDGIEALKQDKVEIDELLNNLGETIAHARKDITEESKMYAFGHKDNTKTLIHDILHKQKDPLIKTGYTAFDNENGGLPTHGVVILAGTTSGGKSVLAMNILYNAYLSQHISACRVSFEMDDEQEGGRFLSRVSGVPYFKFVQSKLNPREKKFIQRKVKEFRLIGKKTNSRFAQICPTRSMTIDDTLLMIKPFGFKVVAIDYVTLLEGADGDNQANALSSIARKCKLYSKETKTLILLLAQLDSESDKVRYSRAMQEHADVVWVWNYSKPEQRETKIIPIRATKVRQGVLSNFELKDEFDVMKISNLDEEDTSIDTDDDTDDETSTEGYEGQQDNYEETGVQ